jgi:hypothetical protein
VVEFALHAVESAKAAAGASEMKAAGSTTYLHVAMRFEGSPCTFDLRLRRL